MLLLYTMPPSESSQGAKLVILKPFSSSCNIASCDPEPLAKFLALAKSIAKSGKTCRIQDHSTNTTSILRCYPPSCIIESTTLFHISHPYLEDTEWPQTRLILHILYNSTLFCSYSLILPSSFENFVGRACLP